MTLNSLFVLCAVKKLLTHSRTRGQAALQHIGLSP